MQSYKPENRWYAQVLVSALHILDLVQCFMYFVKRFCMDILLCTWSFYTSWSQPEGRSCHCLTRTYLLIVSPTARTVCIRTGFTSYACIHLDRWVRRPVRSTSLSVNHIGGFPNHMRIILLHSRQSSKFIWCMPHHLVDIAHNTHFRASNHCCSDTSFSKLFRNSSTLLNPSYIGKSLTSVAT